MNEKETALALANFLLQIKAIKLSFYMGEWIKITYLL